MFNIKIFLGILVLAVIVGCAAIKPAPVQVQMRDKEVDYVTDVKPILDKRCVTCHSCYNSPCQSKYSSFEGLDRGASKLKVYNATRLKAADPTRLFIDAQNTSEWREKGFFTLTQSSDSNMTHNDSIMMHMLYNKKMHPEVVGSYDPENEKLLCPKNSKELGEYFKKKPNHGMPYGLPAIEDREYVTLASWLHQGAKGPSDIEQKELTSPSPLASMEIKKRENFLNKDDAKHTMTARYLYEHLYLAHLNFKSTSKEFFEVVRSYTPAPQAIKIIPTLRPFDDPEVKKFYYRIQKIHSTIVHKTHMVVELDDTKLERFQELFIEPKWLEEPHVMDYDIKTSANPFLAFAQIPVKSRYQFLLDNSHYTIMTFIRGPVCRGQMALNVIHDHFWVMFKDPAYDITVQYPKILTLQAENLSLPIESVEGRIIKVFSDEYRDKYAKYYDAKVRFTNIVYPNGQPIESIWRGNSDEDAPLLTIYRHYDSASVHKGVYGEEPRTMWVIDYPQFERIYYTLVAGYNVFGNVTHQTNIRRYMDFLRAEGEGNFLAYMPKESRLSMFKSWYIGDKDVQKLKSSLLKDRGTSIEYKTSEPKREFIRKVVNEHILKETGIEFDEINYVNIGEELPALPSVYKTRQDFIDGARSLTAPGTDFIRYVSDRGLNNIFIRIKLPDGSYNATYLVINRWHDNVNSLFSEEKTLNSQKDTIDILP
ncbi:MAG: peptidylprolyl isomerase, partial [Sulfurimonas sp.]|nr:peptidylprolyl isomerase [Sulfurimonas sp.]